MYRARERVEHEPWLEDIAAGVDALGLDDDARVVAEDLFLSAVPDADRSKPPAAAASLYAAALISGAQRSQGAVADAMGVSRLAIQTRWKDRLRDAGLEPPEW